MFIRINKVKKKKIWTQNFENLISIVKNEINVSPDIENNSEEFLIVPIKLKMKHKNHKMHMMKL